jgi:hypothetical protein
MKTGELIHTKYTVDQLCTTGSGAYAIYLDKEGTKCWTRDRGYKRGDVVEEYCDQSGNRVKIIVNGKQIL